jgi:hypothetical protein
MVSRGPPVLHQLEGATWLWTHLDKDGDGVECG